MKPLARPLAAAAVVLSLAAPALAERLYVPSEAFPTVQSAVDAAVEGDVIVMDGGIQERVVIEDKSNLTLVGTDRRAGPFGHFTDSGPEATIRIVGGWNIVLRGFSVGAWSWDKDACISATGVSNLLIRNVNLRGDTDYGIRTTDCNGVSIKHCTFQGPECGIVDASSFAVAIEGCRFIWMEGDIISLSPGAAPGAGSDMAVVRRNYSVRWFMPYGTGVQIVGDGAVVMGNRLPKGGSLGIRVVGDAAIVAQNRTGEGIRVQGAGATVRGNHVTSDTTCIFLEGIGFAVERNVVRGDGYGIYVDAPSSTLTGNRAFRRRGRGMGGIGIWVVSEGVTLRWNDFRGSGIVDLADAHAEGVNLYIRNKFRTTEFEYVP